MSVLEGAFEGRARVWFDAQRNMFMSYRDFKNKFLAEFYSIPTRVNLKLNWLNRRFEGDKHNLRSYFLNQIRDAQYFVPEMESFELHFTIIQQMPIRVREMMSTIDFNDFDKISQTLSQLDLTFGEKVNSRSRNNNNQFRDANNDQFHKCRKDQRNQEYSKGSNSNGPRGDRSAGIVNSQILA